MAATALASPARSVTTKDSLLILTPALLAGISMFFTCLWEGRIKQLTENEMTQNFSQKETAAKRREKKEPSVIPKQKEPFRNVLDLLWFSVSHQNIFPVELLELFKVLKFGSGEGEGEVPSFTISETESMFFHFSFPSKQSKTSLC